MDSLGFHRFHFAFTIVFHYLFPQLTMGLGLLISFLRYQAAWKKSVVADETATFWTKIFGLNFAIGVVTGVPMEFQFGTNWSRFSERAGGVVGQSLAMEGIFAFFLESTFLYFLLFGKRFFSPKGHFFASIMVTLGSWLSGWFIITANAWMQHPVGQSVDADGILHVSGFFTYMANPWSPVEYAHTMMGTLVTASFVMASVGAFYVLSKKHLEHARLSLKVGVIAGLVGSIAMAMPTGDMQAKLVAEHQPVAFAAMEGHYRSDADEEGVGMVLIGQPNPDKLTVDNPIVVPRVLSFLTYKRWDAKIKSLDQFDKEDWPDNPALLYYAYHLMVGLGTLFVALMSLSTGLHFWKQKLYQQRAVLWALMLSLPFPYIANTAGWMTAELGRQPWLIYGVMRTKHGSSDQVSSGNVLFSLLGYLGLDALLAIIFFFLVVRIVTKGPGASRQVTESGEAK